MADLKFKCPDCHNEKLEEVCSNAAISVPVTITDDGNYGTFGKVEVLESHPDRFQCDYCGYTISDDTLDPIVDTEEVATWLRANCNQG